MMAQPTKTAFTGDRPIGVFDSGVGGFTVARAISRAMPHESIVYIGDTARCPYGTRGVEEVRAFVAQVGTWLVRQRVKVIVIACNTATASALGLAQRMFDVPVIGVIGPGARAAVLATRTREIGVLATDLTIASGAYLRAIKNLDAGVGVHGCATQRFVELVESRLAGGIGADAQWLDGADLFDTPEVRALVRRETEPLRGLDIDAVVLGCTHFPLLVRPIRAVLGRGVHVVSSAEETMRELHEMLACQGHLAPSTARPEHRFATTSENTSAFAEAGRFIFGSRLVDVEHVGIDELSRLASDRQIRTRRL
ncbi:glutamate racemase [Coriobacterium glomerans PW2]|uniref:Glutamate racemase n=1 Tax=Coriobacterium glomerans (strain ATCC 49209 / DSM 20642 / JCM 10262 / PW2) TaxID=700015 RepID=F2NAP8_CORGP|nr:glutamate racemase [Coriobacterium glomerans]AEB07504.1 glutamate racemase [Coriobacterium glomerans PW2]